LAGRILSDAALADRFCIPHKFELDHICIIRNTGAFDCFDHRELSIIQSSPNQSGGHH